MIIVYWIGELEKFIRHFERHIARDGNNSTHFTVMTGETKILRKCTAPKSFRAVLRPREKDHGPFRTRSIILLMR